jgi:hypothetical protein
MTSDGISQDDWDVVATLAAQIANDASSEENSSEELTQKLLEQLDRLESKYGLLPSILATRADYLSDFNRRIQSLESAWSAATQISDNANRTFIASSLAALFIDELRDVPNGKRWLSHLGEALETYWDDHEYKEFQRLEHEIKADDNVKV